MLCGSLAIPALTAALPKVPLAVMRDGSSAAWKLRWPSMKPCPRGPAESAGSAPRRPQTLRLGACRGDDLCPGRLRASAAPVRRSGDEPAFAARQPCDRQATEGIEIRESDRVAAPVTLGIVRPAIVLPADWRQWDAPKLDAVLAHERSHIRRHDPAVQLLSAIHRALLWHSPLSWFLHQRIVRVAEEASDDAAVAVTRDRASYAEVLLEFMQRGVRGANWLGVPMARYGRPDERIQRILDGTALSRGVTRWSVAAILALGSPLAYVVAAAHPQAARHAQATDAVAARPPPEVARSCCPAPQPQTAARLSEWSGHRRRVHTVTIKPRIDGQLMSVGFKEGDLVQAGPVAGVHRPPPLSDPARSGRGPARSGPGAARRRQARPRRDATLPNSKAA